jgi:hypothetical protein
MKIIYNPSEDAKAILNQIIQEKQYKPKKLTKNSKYIGPSYWKHLKNLKK